MQDYQVISKNNNYHLKIKRDHLSRIYAIFMTFVFSVREYNLGCIRIESYGKKNGTLNSLN